MVALPKISVIIPVYNAADSLGETLKALREQDYPKEHLEIIVVDNNSTDNPERVAAEIPGVTVVYEREIQNAAAARNRGISIATGTVIAFTDADCTPAKNWLKQGIIAMVQNNADRVGGRVVIEPVSPKSSTATLLDVCYHYHQEVIVKKYQAAITGNFISKKLVIEQVGQFNTEFFELEDIELGLRAAAAGFSICYAPDCSVSHPPRTTAREMWKKSKRYGCGSFTICHHNPNWAGRWGWKHPLRVIRMLLSPRRLYWERLPFPPSQISWNKRILIYVLLWVTIHVAEALGYIQGAVRELRKSISEILKR